MGSGGMENAVQSLLAAAAQVKMGIHLFMSDSVELLSL